MVDYTEDWLDDEETYNDCAEDCVGVVVKLIWPVSNIFLILDGE